MPLISVSDLYFTHDSDPSFSLTLNAFQIAKGERIFLEGPSGSGKTTVLNLLTGMLIPNRGNIEVLGKNISDLRNVQRDRFRADHFGLIFQMFNLINYLSVLENIILPCTFSDSRREKALARNGSLVEEAKRLCAELDITPELQNKPVAELSIGQQQRVAIARALIGEPEIVVADEPTSALDDDRKQQFMELLLNECEKYNATLLFVSHDKSLKPHFTRHEDLATLMETPRRVTT